MPDNTPEWREQHAIEQRQAMLKLGVPKGFYPVGKSSEALFEKLKGEADELATHVRLCIEDCHGGLPADLGAEIERAVVHGYIQGFAAGAAEQHKKTKRAAGKSARKKKSMAAASKSRIIANYLKQTATKKTARVQAVAEATGFSKTAVWKAIKGIE